MKKKANIYHHTHWDNEWYFTEEDSLIQLTYHMKELLEALENNVIDYFYLDGQSAILEDYLELHQEDKDRVTKLIQDGRLFAGPFLTQIDSFITSGESMINNLRIGMNYVDQYGGTSKVAYLPDSFGQSQDYPKIFRQCGIDSFVFRRGMGDEHELPLDFIYQSNDGSKVITTTLNCGYGFATEPFINHRLTKDAGLDYDGKDISSQLKKLAALSTLEDEFLLPIGNDQTPVIWNFKELLEEYKKDDLYDFEEITLSAYMDKLKENEDKLKIYQGEFINPQYHRVHRSIYSARMDIKVWQDRLERMMALEIQPIMTILQDLGLHYDDKLVNRIWNLLGRSQTHSAATNTDKTNNLILGRTLKAYNLAEALKVYLIRKIAISLPKDNIPIVFFNTLPQKRDMVLKLKVYTRKSDFSLSYQNEILSYTRLSQEKIYGGVVRKNISHHDESLYFYETEIEVCLPEVDAFSYGTILVHDKKKYISACVEKVDLIENDYYKITRGINGFDLYVKENGETIQDFIYLEESGDEGDNYDFSNPEKDMILMDTFRKCNFEFNHTKNSGVLSIDGKFKCPMNLKQREQNILDNEDEYHIEIRLTTKDKVISVKGYYDNKAENHRIRLVFKTPYQTITSIAGTQFGYIERNNYSKLMDIWKKDGWLEEPTSIYPLLNYVMLNNEKDEAYGVYTKSSKEYQIVGENYSDIALTIFRSVGHLGLPDLNRRPGRASGIAEKIISSPQSQMKQKNEFEFGFTYMKSLDFNKVVNQYNAFVCEPCYYQNQRMNRVVYPISYFETNPLRTEVPMSYCLSINMNHSLAFSTLEMYKGKKICRFFNNGDAIVLTNDIQKYDLLGEKIEESKEIKKGEILNIEL